MRRYLATVLISVMLIGLLFIYLVTPVASQATVGRLAIILMAGGLFLGYYSGDERQRGDSIKLLSALTGIITLAAIALIGRRIFDSDIGAFCLPMIFLMIGMVAFSLYMRRALRVEDGYVLVVDRQVGGGNYVRASGLYPPLLPAIEEAFALLPDYELTTTVEVDQPDTHLLFKPEKVRIFARYRIRDLTASEKTELEDQFEAAEREFKRERLTHAELIERMIKRLHRKPKEKGLIPRNERELLLVGQSKMSPEELADREAAWQEQQHERIEAEEEAWELFNHPYASYLRLSYHFPNRDRVIAQLAKEWGLEPDLARQQSEFWIDLIRKQISHEIEEITREVIHSARGIQVRDGQVLWKELMGKKKEEPPPKPSRRKKVERDDDDDDEQEDEVPRSESKPEVPPQSELTPLWGPYGPVEISEHRHELAHTIMLRLQRRVRRWGLRILELEIEQVKLYQASVDFKYRSMNEGIKDLLATKEALREAERIKVVALAEAERIRSMGAAEVEHEAQHIRSKGRAEADALTRLVEHLAEQIKESGTPLTETEIKRLFFEALEEQKKLAYRVSPSKPGGKS